MTSLLFWIYNCFCFTINFYTIFMKSKLNLGCYYSINKILSLFFNLLLSFIKFPTYLDGVSKLVLFNFEDFSGFIVDNDWFKTTLLHPTIDLYPYCNTLLYFCPIFLKIVLETYLFILPIFFIKSTFSFRVYISSIHSETYR